LSTASLQPIKKSPAATSTVSPGVASLVQLVWAAPPEPALAAATPALPALAIPPEPPLSAAPESCAELLQAASKSVAKAR
jgi:hypothetical protein